MTSELQTQKIIRDLQQAFRLHQREPVENLWRLLETLVLQQPALNPWLVYFQGYRLFEFERDWGRAEHLLTELLQAHLEPILRGHTLYLLGRTLDAQARWLEAIAAFDQSLALWTKQQELVEQARTWKHKAISYHKGFTQGDLEAGGLSQAEVDCQAALTALKTIPNSSSDISWLEGTVWNTLGLIYVSLNRWDEAITCYQHDLNICQELGDLHGMSFTYGNLGEVYHKQRNWSAAQTTYEQALTIMRKFENHYESLEPLANLALLHQEMGQLEIALDYYGQVIQVIETLRANISAEMAQAGFFATVADIYAHTVLLCLEMGRPEEAFNRIEQARSRTFLDSLTTRSPELAAQVQRPEEPTGAATMTLAEVQAALPPDALLLEYFTTGLVETAEGQKSSQGAQRHRFPPARTWLFAVTCDTVVAHDTGLNPNTLRPNRLDSVVERYFLKSDIRRTLYQQLIDPVEALLPGKQRLYLAPHGPLHYIPVQALLAGDKETLLRPAGPALVYTPSATLLFRGQIKPPAATWPACLALGYNGAGETHLHFAEEEAQRIAHLTGGKALAGPQPKKAELYRQAGAYRWLHFACHGEFDPDDPLASTLWLAPAELLTALDILDDLRLNCDLVTLSACESGLSRVRRGDELVGLTRAFRYAGAPALVSTLWRVDDRSTRILMEKFYQEIGAGRDYAEALKQAQLYLKSLTHREAQKILASSPAPTDEPSSFQPHPTLSTGERIGRMAGAYLRGSGGQDEAELTEILSGEADDEPIFASPTFWASFVLVGGAAEVHNQDS